MQLADRVLQFHNVGVASLNVRQRLPGLLRLHNDLKKQTGQCSWGLIERGNNQMSYALSENGRIALFQHFLELFVGSRAPG